MKITARQEEKQMMALFERQIPRLPEESHVPAALWISEKQDARGRCFTALNKRGPPVGIGDRYDLKALKRFPFYETTTSASLLQK
jgi:hypothetical protein